MRSPFARLDMRTRLAALVLGALVGLLALAGLAIAIERSHDRAHDDALARLDVRSQVSAELLAGTVELGVTQSIVRAEDRLSDEVLTPEAFEAWLEETESTAPYAAVFDADGNEIVRSPADKPPPMVDQTALDDALDGHPSTSAVIGSGRNRSVELMIPFDAGEAGRRVIVSSIPLRLVSPFLAATLASAPGSEAGGALVLDRNGEAIATVGGGADSAAVRRALRQAVERGDASGAVDGDHYAIERVQGTSWNVALVAPESELVAELPSPLWPRLALAAFAITLVVVGVMAVRAIGASRRLEEARASAIRANDAKSRFLTHMSHEFKQPLAAILGFSDILLQRPDLSDADRRHFTSVVARSGRNLEQLVNELLDISRIESGRVLLSIERVDPRRAIDDAISIDEALAADRHVSFDLRYEIPDDARVLADPMRLRQVLLNLLSNAIKYNRDGGAVTVVTQMRGASIRILVRDEGHGIAPGDIPRLFHPFERLSEQRGPVAGTGLGLVITKGLVEAMDGTLDVESVVGKGSTFAFELPATKVGAEEAAAESGGEIPGGRSAGAAGGGITGRVLYIEDEPANRELVEHVLGRERPGLEVATAADGESGVRSAEEHPPDLLLLDLNLPDITGEQVLRRFRSKHETSDVPVIIVSSDATSLSITRLLGTGADAYVTKPLDVPRFLETVDVLIRQHQRARANAKRTGAGATDDVAATGELASRQN